MAELCVNTNLALIDSYVRSFIYNKTLSIFIIRNEFIMRCAFLACVTCTR